MLRSLSKKVKKRGRNTDVDLKDGTGDVEIYSLDEDSVEQDIRESLPAAPGPEAQSRFTYIYRKYDCGCPAASAAGGI